MKFIFKIIVLIFLVLSLKNCNSRAPKNLVTDPAFLFMLYENSVYKNYCPTTNAVLDSGTYTITLSEGEEYWFDISAARSYKTVYIGISTSSNQTLTFFNDSCSYNYTITNQRKTFTADNNKSIQYEEGGFSYYAFRFSPSSDSPLAAIKMASGNGDITIIIP